jgi:ABC-type multidrug transport system fused ATPase/permease subunit
LRDPPEGRTVNAGKNRPFAARTTMEGQMNSVLARFLPGHTDANAASEREHRERQQVTFTDLTWDHFHWEQQRRTGTCERPKAAARYRDTRAAFEARYGEIVGEYWSIVEPSGVALTFKKAPLVLGPFINDRREFHRSTDWVTRHNPPLADVLFDCENLSIRISEVLRYTSESVGLKRIMAVASHVLGVIDRAGGVVDDDQAKGIAAKEDLELREIRDYYRRAGVRIGRTVYTQGMIIGVMLMAALVALVVAPLVLWSSVTWDSNLHEIVLSAAAGSIGAFVSVLQRMASEKSKFVVHYDLGKRTLYMLGSYRVVLGAVFGVFTYFVLASQVLGTKPPTEANPLYYYGSLAFVAGFSERFTQVLAKNVAGLVPAQGTDEPEPEGEPTVVGQPDSGSR